MSFKDLDAFFDPAKSLLLAPGYVSHGWRATEAQITAAREKFKNRATRWLLLDERRQTKLQSILAREAQFSKMSEETEPWASSDDFARALANGFGCAYRHLPFYHRAFLVHWQFAEATPEDPSTLRFVVLEDQHRIVPLSGESDCLHDLNDSAPLHLHDSTVEDYLVFFCEHICGKNGCFYVPELDARDSPSAFPDVLSTTATDTRIGAEILKDVPDGASLLRGPFARAEIAMPVTLLQSSSSEEWDLIATVVYDDIASRAGFRVLKNGYVNMMTDSSLDGCAIQMSGQPWLPPSRRRAIRRNVIPWSARDPM